MDPQKPAEGIMLIYDSIDTKLYEIPCTCQSPDDTISLEVESDEFGEIIIYVHTTVKTHWWKKLVDWNYHKFDNFLLYYFVEFVQNFINGLYQRIRITAEVWRHGYCKYQSTCILNSQRALNFAETLKTAIKDLENK